MIRLGLRFSELLIFVVTKTYTMASVLKRDTAFENLPSIKAKTLRINLNPDIYGTFAEIGAGQETARHFFSIWRSFRHHCQSNERL